MSTFYVDDFGNLIPIVNTHSVLLDPGEVEWRRRGRGEDKI